VRHGAVIVSNDWRLSATPRLDSPSSTGRSRPPATSRTQSTDGPCRIPLRARSDTPFFPTACHFHVRFRVPDIPPERACVHAIAHASLGFGRPRAPSPPMCPFVLTDRHRTVALATLSLSSVRRFLRGFPHGFPPRSSFHRRDSDKDGGIQVCREKRCRRCVSLRARVDFFLNFPSSLAGKARRPNGNPFRSANFFSLLLSPERQTGFPIPRNAIKVPRRPCSGAELSPCLSPSIDQVYFVGLYFQCCDPPLARLRLRRMARRSRLSPLQSQHLATAAAITQPSKCI